MIRKAKSFQDAHSAGEQVVYHSLWNNGREVADQKFRTFTGGYGAIAALTGFHPSTVKRNLKSLIEKLTIERLRPEDSKTSTGATYRVYSFKESLDRRKAARLTYVKRQPGVRLLSSECVGGDISDEGPQENPRPVRSLAGEDAAPQSTAITGAPARTHTPPVGKSHTQSGTGEEILSVRTSSAVYESREANSWSDAHIMKARQLLKDHRHSELLPDIPITRRVLQYFKSMAGFSEWIGNLEGRFPGSKVKSWGFYPSVAKLDAEAAEEKAQKSAKHFAECPGAVFCELPVSAYRGRRVLDGAVCDWPDCPKRHALLVHPETGVELERLTKEEARKRGPEWITYKERERLKVRDKQRDEIVAACEVPGDTGTPQVR